MMYLRDFKTGRPESERHVLCGASAAEVPTTRANIEWWRGRAEFCRPCWDEWHRTLETVMGLRP
jgi:hypothetical protein